MSGWRVAFFLLLLLLLDEFFSDLGAASWDSLLLEITSFQRQPRISFRKFIDRRNGRRNIYIYIYTCLLYIARRSHGYRFHNYVSQNSKRIGARYEGCKRDEIRFKKQYAPFCLSWTRYPLILGEGIDGRSMRFTMRQLHALSGV